MGGGEVAFVFRTCLYVGGSNPSKENSKVLFLSMMRIMDMNIGICGTKEERRNRHFPPIFFLSFFAEMDILGYFNTFLFFWLKTHFFVLSSAILKSNCYVTIKKWRLSVIYQRCLIVFLMFLTESYILLSSYQRRTLELGL